MEHISPDYYYNRIQKNHESYGLNTLDLAYFCNEFTPGVKLTEYPRSYQRIVRTMGKIDAYFDKVVPVSHRLIYVVGL